jgi:hypothetical protein
MSKKTIAVALVLVLATAVLVYNSGPLKQARFVKELVARNIDVRGGPAAWEAVNSLRLSGKMDLGQGMVVPYVLEQKRPGKMCFRFEFDDATSIQCAVGDSGWKIAPFRGRTAPEPMTDVELRETADSADLYGPLYNYAARGHDVTFEGREALDGREVFKLKVTLPRGGVRWLYLDAETALEVKLETMRTIAGKERRVETLYSDWQPSDGLLIARRQDTRTEGDAESHFFTVASVDVNPPLDDAHFLMPASTVDGRPAQSTAR